MTHPTLFKRASSGKIQQWTISVEGNVITKAYGQVGGAIQVVDDVVKKGKNVGRANATTPEQQAEAEAAAQWEKKLKKDYVKTAEAAAAGETSELIDGGIWPMLAHRYDKKGDKIVFPALAQPKFDGHRCIAMIVDNVCTLWSRTRKQIHSLPHLVKQIGELGLGTAILDGELYNHAYRDEFETITHLIKRETPCPGGAGCSRSEARGGPCKGYTEVEYHVYDMAGTDGPNSERNDRLSAILPGNEYLVQVETVEVMDEDDVMLAFERWLEEGYEGAIIRNKAGKYKSVSATSRSNDLQKVKEFDDDEFMITDVKEGRGRMAGHAVFICETAEGNPFDAKMKGKLELLKQYWEDKSLAVGRMMTVQYQGYTKKSKVPRFPVAVRFREDV